MTAYYCSLVLCREYCLCCGKRTGAVPLCKSCIKKIINPDFCSVFNNRCRICGKELVSEDDFCMQCREFPVVKNADKCFPVYSYRGWKKNLLFEWKINGKRNLSYVFTDLLINTIKNIKTIQKIDEIPVVPVPPRKGKINKNGWDQIDEVCRLLEKLYGKKVLKLLSRKSVVQQKKKDRNQRLESIGKAFEESKLGQEMKNNGKIPEEVILFDDVTTTGVTVEECSRILKNLGVLKVNVITFFIVD